MSKIKINFKLLVAVFGLMLLAGLIPLGFQALATDEAAAPAVDPAAPAVDPGAPAVDPGCPNPEPSPAAPVEAAAPGEGAPTAPANGKVLEFTRSSASDPYVIITKGNEYSFNLDEYDVVETVIKDHVGYVYVTHANGPKECYGITFVDYELKKVEDWTPTEVDSTIKYNAPTLAEYDPVNPAVEEDAYYYQMGQLLYNGVPLVGAEASWVNLEDGSYITEYTNELGFVCLKIPYEVLGSTHVIADGFVSDYSVPRKIKLTPTPDFPDAPETPEFIVVNMMKGIECTVQTNLADTWFHVHEHVSNSAIVPTLNNTTEDVYLNVVPTRMLPEGAQMMVLTDDVCDKYGLNHGSLYYYYKGKLPLGANLYEIVFEPDTSYTLDNWTIADVNGEEVMQVGVEYPIHIAEGPYTYQVNYKEKTSETAQTGDSVALIVAAFAGLAVACGFAARRNRKLS